MSRNADLAQACIGDGRDGYLPRLDCTPETHPDHHTVGHDFMAHGYPENNWQSVRWFCVCHDQAGYWMFATDGSGMWTNVSERAIGRTFHEIHPDEGWGEWSQWGASPPYINTPRHAAWLEKRSARNGL